jgi:hypothetical protein
MTGVSDAIGVTTIAKLLTLALDVPSLTTMVMFEYVPACAELGEPDSSPVDVLKVAQLGQLAIANASALPAALLACG